MSISESLMLGFFTASLCTGLLIHYIFEWDFIIDLFRPKNWSFNKKKKMKEKRESPVRVSSSNGMTEGGNGERWRWMLPCWSSLKGR